MPNGTTRTCYLAEFYWFLSQFEGKLKVLVMSKVAPKTCRESSAALGRVSSFHISNRTFSPSSSIHTFRSFRSLKRRQPAEKMWSSKTVGRQYRAPKEKKTVCILEHARRSEKFFSTCRILQVEMRSRPKSIRLEPPDAWSTLVVRRKPSIHFWFAP